MEFDQQQKLHKKKKRLPYACHKVIWGNGDIDPLILNHCTICKGTQIQIYMYYNCIYLYILIKSVCVLNQLTLYRRSSDRFI